MGVLRIDEVFVKFDGPRLFSCLNESGLRFFGLFVADDSDAEIYLYVPVSPQRYAAIRSGDLPLRVAFEEPVDGGRWIVRVDGETVIAEWRTSEISDDWLPDPDARLNLPTPTQEALSADGLRAEATSLGRPLAAFELDGPWATTEFPLRPVGDMMRLVQETVDSFAQVVRQRTTNRGAVQGDILEETGMSLYDLRAASFAFVVAAAPVRQQVFEPGLVTESIELLFSVMDAASSQEELSSAVESLHPRAVSKFRDFLEELDETGSGLHGLLAAPHQDVRQAQLTREEILSSLDLVRKKAGEETEEFDVEGRLVGINDRTRTFELYDDVHDRSYTGKAIDDARDHITGLTIGARYNAHIVDEQETLAATGETRHKYRLTSIQPTDGQYLSTDPTS